MGYTMTFLLIAACSTLTWSLSQEPPAEDRASAIRESIAANRQALRAYKWVESIEVSVKGDLKSRTQNECQYSPEGEILKTPLADRPKKPGGLKGKLVEKKTGETKEYLERAVSLIRRYVPPDPAQLREAQQAGKVEVQRGEGSSLSTMTINNYAKSGDQFVLTFSEGRVRNVKVDSWLDDPKDKVTLTAAFQTLPDGVNYLADSILSVAAKKMQIHTTNFDHHK